MTFRLTSDVSCLQPALIVSSPSLAKVDFFNSNPNLSNYHPSKPKMTNLKVVFNKFYGEYVQNTPNKLKIVDAYLVYIVLTGVIQFVYCCLVGSFPFNSFLSGFISTISCFILGGKYTIQLNIKSWRSLLLVSCSLPSFAGEPREQSSVRRYFTGTRIRRLHTGPHNSTHCRHEFPGLNWAFHLLLFIMSQSVILFN